MDIIITVFIMSLLQQQPLRQFWFLLPADNNDPGKTTATKDQEDLASLLGLLTLSASSPSAVAVADAEKPEKQVEEESSTFTFPSWARIEYGPIESVLMLWPTKELLLHRRSEGSKRKVLNIFKFRSVEEEEQQQESKEERAWKWRITPLPVKPDIVSHIVLVPVHKARSVISGEYIQPNSMILKNILTGSCVSRNSLIAWGEEIFQVTQLDPWSDSADYRYIHSSTTISFGTRLGEKLNYSLLGKTLSHLGLKSRSSHRFTHSLGGLKEISAKIHKVIDMHNNHLDIFSKLNIEPHKGILIYGPPGTGKTHLVHVIAEECHAELITVNGSEILSPYIGDSEMILKNILNEAEEKSRNSSQLCILFLDDLDALCPKRDELSSGISQRLVAQLLIFLDGLTSRGKLMVLAATNKPNQIDTALRRPGRLDFEIAIPIPDEKARKEILENLTKSYKLDVDLNLEKLAESCYGYVGSDLVGLTQEAIHLSIHSAETEGERSFMLKLDHFQQAMVSIPPSVLRDKSAVSKLTSNKSKTNSWDDIGGLEEVKKKLQRAVIWPLQHPATFKRMNIKPPRGILLYGPPGCSKTTLIRTLANVSGCTFFTLSGAEIYSSFVGDTERTIRDLFRNARSSVPSIIFLDEVDTLVGRRHLGGEAGDVVQERLLSTLLNEMDGIEAADGVIVAGATNRPDMLDAALLRPGRFDEVIYVPLPALETRVQILRVHTRVMPLDTDVDIPSIASKTEFYSGAELENLCVEAALNSLRRDISSKTVNQSDFDKALMINESRSTKFSSSRMDEFAEAFETTLKLNSK